MMKPFVPDASAQILVVGDLILDRYLHGETTRISPEAPVPVVKVSKTEERPGGAANVALNISALGVGVQLVGITGEDESADILQEILSKENVHCRFFQQHGFPTITKLRVLSQHQQLIRLDYETDAANIDTKASYKLYEEALDGAEVVVLSDYAKGSLKNVEVLIERARQKGIKLLVDPKGSDFERYRYADLITPNLKEFEAIVGACKNEVEIENKGKALCESLELGALLVTRGEQGMTLINVSSDSCLHLSAQAHEVFDVTGAGDTVIATLAAALASGQELEQSVHYANYAAGLVVEKLGTATVTSDELNNTIQTVKSVNSCITHAGKLAEQGSLLRTQGKKLVMTNGCFDLLHAGHVQYLQEARALGDCLVVAVNDDQSVKSLKGSGRPINPLVQRMTVLAGLAAVDWVVPFSEETPAGLISQIQPDILVKGGDYEVEQIAGADFVRESGGEVVILPFHEGCSTTELVNTIQSSKNEG